MWESRTSRMASAIATKKNENQDAVTCSTGPRNTMLVADGIGSIQFAGIGAEEVVRIMDELIHQEESDDFKELFRKTQKKLESFADTFESEDWDKEKRAFGTTLIAAIEDETTFKIGYLGNGAILHIRGDFVQAHVTPFIIPWTHANLLNPHTIPIEGQEVLVRGFAVPNSPERVEPTVLTIEKEELGPGDILVICTDGIYSRDQEGVAEDTQGQLWRQERFSLKLLCDCLKSFVTGENHASSQLETMLQNYLEELKEIPREMTDDCAIAVIVTQRVLDYNNELNGEHTDQ